MVIFHSYVSLPEGRCLGSWLRCQSRTYEDGIWRHWKLLDVSEGSHHSIFVTHEANLRFSSHFEVHHSGDSVVFLAKDFTEDDCIGSPYAVHEYLCNPTLGTEELELWAGVMTFLQI